MSKPVVINLPHNLGADEARRRMQNGIGGLKDHIPGGAAEVESRWDGDRMHLAVRAMGQEVVGHIDVEERKVRMEMMLPAMFALFSGAIEKALTKGGGMLLEDKSKRPKG